MVHLSSGVRVLQESVTLALPAVTVHLSEPTPLPLVAAESLRHSGSGRGQGVPECLVARVAKREGPGGWWLRAAPVLGTDATLPSRWAWILQDALGIAFCLYMLKTIRLPTFKVRASGGGAWASPGLVPPGSALAFPSKAGPEVTVHPTLWKSLRNTRGMRQCLPAAQPCRLQCWGSWGTCAQILHRMLLLEQSPCLLLARAEFSQRLPPGGAV